MFSRLKKYLKIRRGMEYLALGTDSMHIEVYQTESDSRDWWVCPPALYCTHEQEELIREMWREYIGGYIPDPLAAHQGLYAIFIQLPGHERLIPKIKKTLLKP